MKVRMFKHHDVYTVRRWMTDNFGQEGIDWWIVDSRTCRDNRNPILQGREDTIAFYDQAHETYCALIANGGVLSLESMTYNA